MGSTDPLLNNGAGALKMVFSYLAPWGTPFQPTPAQPYSLWLDMTNTGTYQYAYYYVPSGQATCAVLNNQPAAWINEHQNPLVSGSYQISSATPPNPNGWLICFSVAASYWSTNLHWCSGQSTISAGLAVWGTTPGIAAAMFLKN